MTIKEVEENLIERYQSTRVYSDEIPTPCKINLKYARVFVKEGNSITHVRRYFNIYKEKHEKNKDK